MPEKYVRRVWFAWLPTRSFSIVSYNRTQFRCFLAKSSRRDDYKLVVRLDRNRFLAIITRKKPVKVTVVSSGNFGNHFRYCLKFGSVNGILVAGL